MEEAEDERDREEEDRRRAVEREHPVEGDRAEEGVLGDRQLQPHQHELERGDEEEPEGGADQHPADVLVVGAGRDPRPARSLARESVDDQLGTLARDRAHGVSPREIRPTTRSCAAWMSFSCLAMKLSYSSGETTSTSVRIAA